MSASPSVFAALCDVLLWPAERGALGRRRAAVARELGGCVRDLGAGTGLHLRHLGPGRRDVGVDPNSAMLARAAAVSAAFVLARGERLPFADRAFDAALATLVLCIIPAALAAPPSPRSAGSSAPGALSFSWSTSGPPAPSWRRPFAGCHVNRDTPKTLRDAGFSLQVAERWFGGIWVRGIARPV